MSFRASKKAKRARNGINGIEITVIVIGIIAVAALVIFIVYYKNGRISLRRAGEDTQQIEGDMPEEDAVPTADGIPAGDETGLQEPGANIPDGWYAMYDSNGPMEITPDLSTYREKCKEVYAYIDVPGTDIGYPIAFCEDSDEPFYFTHDITGAPSDKGMIITDSLNSNDFSDPMTLVFGQNPEDGTMFAQLHRFADAGFFEDHDRFSVCFDDAQLVYKIYACYTDSDDHIFVTYDFDDPAGFATYFDHIGELRDLSMNVREEAKPVFGDHVVALITHCDDESKRWFVVGVLDEVRY